MPEVNLNEIAGLWQTWACMGAAFLGVGAIWAKILQYRKYGNLRTNADVARAAAKVGRHLMRIGFTRETAMELAAHELSHGLSDKSKSKYPASITVHPNGADYYFDSSDPQNTWDIATAPSRSGRSTLPMSEQDVKLADSVKDQRRGR